MYGWRDMTFCSAKCLTDTCPRHKGIVDREHKDDAWPVSWCDYSLACPEFRPEPDKTDGKFPS